MGKKEKEENFVIHQFKSRIKRNAFIGFLKSFEHIFDLFDSFSAFVDIVLIFVSHKIF